VLTLRDNKLEWKITKSSGIHYFPMSSVLSRQKKHPPKSPNHAKQLQAPYAPPSPRQTHRAGVASYSACS
jgi:hypothetical protein